MTKGDGLLIGFASVVNAVHCAVEVQRAMGERDVPAPKRSAAIMRADP
jgi:class 3 adenylate cyclase